MDTVGGMSELSACRRRRPGPASRRRSPRRRGIGTTNALWIGLGIGGLVLVLCCVGGIAGIGVLAAGGDSTPSRRPARWSGHYLEAISTEDYAEAYEQLCDEITEKVSQADFERAYSGDKLESYTVGAVTTTNTITVPATLEWQDRGTVEARYTLVPATPVLKICGGL